MKYLFLLLITGFAHVSFSQKMVVDVNPKTAQILVESIPSKNPAKLNLKTGSMGLVAINKGYATQGYSFAELKKMNKETFSFTLEKISPLGSDYKSKSLELAKITDATGKVDKPDRPGLYGITVKGTQLNSTPFLSAITGTLADFKYKIDAAGDQMFEDKSKAKDPADLAIGGELQYFSKDKRGDGFQVSIIIEWSIYSHSEKKVIKKITTAGYSDTGETQFNPELISAFKDATLGLAGNLEFQKLVSK